MNAFIYDMQGKLLQNSEIQKRTLYVSNLASGMYYIIVYDKNNIEILNQKFIKE